MHGDDSRQFDKGARWALAAINEALQNGKLLDNQLPDVLVAFENKLNDYGAFNFKHRLPQILGEAIREVHNDEFVPLD